MWRWIWRIEKVWRWIWRIENVSRWVWRIEHVWRIDQDHTRMEICIMPYGGQHLFVRFCSVSNFLLVVGVLFYFLVVFWGGRPDYSSRAKTSKNEQKLAKTSPAQTLGPEKHLQNGGWQQ